MQDKRNCLCFRSTQQKWLGPNPHRAQRPVGGRLEGKGWSLGRAREPGRYDRGEPHKFEVFCVQLKPGQTNQNDVAEDRMSASSVKQDANVGKAKSSSRKVFRTNTRHLLSIATFNELAACFRPDRLLAEARDQHQNNHWHCCEHIIV